MAENSTIARPYAQAVYSLARDKDALARWTDILSVLSEIASNDEILAVAQNPDIANDIVSGIVCELCGDLLDDEVKRFVELLVDNDRLAVLPEITDQYETLRAESEKTAKVEVVTAYELNAKQKTSIKTAMKKRLGCEVDLSARTDKNLLAGAIIRVGDLVIDGSAVTQLGKLNHALSR